MGLILSINACTGLPEGVTPVSNFSLPKYLGTWYEVARLDHSFERGLERVSATYSLREDGGIKVLNKGFSVADQEWQEAEGRAYFIGDETTAHLKVSFFGPFFGAYAVFELDSEQYQYAFISGNTTDYLWLLSRTPEVSPELKEHFEETARQLGFDLDELIYVNHDIE